MAPREISSHAVNIARALRAGCFFLGYRPQDQPVADPRRHSRPCRKRHATLVGDDPRGKGTTRGRGGAHRGFAERNAGRKGFYLDSATHEKKGKTGKTEGGRRGKKGVHGRGALEIQPAHQV